MLQMELATWAPKYRDTLLQGTAEHYANYIKENGPLQVSVRNPSYKPGLQQIWWDIAGNRSFSLWYARPDSNNPISLYKEYKPMLGIANIELVNVMEIEDLLEDAKLPGRKRDVVSKPSSSPSIQIEIIKWPPENRFEMLKYAAYYIKEIGIPPVSMKNPPYDKPGNPQLWWDITSNRSFCLLNDMPGFNKPEGILNEYKPGLDIMNFELINVMEICDVLQDAGQL